MYRGRLWTMRMYAGFGTAEESNERYKYLVSQGSSGLSVAFDLPTQIGYDSDHSLAEGEVGKVGVAIDSLADMEVLFEGIPLMISTSTLTPCYPLGMYIAVGRRRSSAPKLGPFKATSSKVSRRGHTSSPPSMMDPDILNIALLN